MTIIVSSAGEARILLVEDNAVNQLVAVQMLARQGHRADVAENGRAGLAALAAGRYELVLMDCQMPEMDGYEATTEIRRREVELGAPRVPVVAITAHSMRGERERCLAAGMDDYLSKPFRLQQLAGVLDRWLPPAGATAAAGLLVDPASMRRLGADAEDAGPAREVVELFRADGASRLEAARAALGREAAGDLRQAAHALRGGSAMIGANLVAQICGEIEDNCTPLNALVLGPLLDRLDEALADTADALATLIGPG